MPPSPQLTHLTLCIPGSADRAELLDFAANVSAFFQKFPVNYEVLIATALPAVQTGDLGLPAPFRIVAVKNPNARAKNLKRLFEQAEGDVLFAMDLDLAIPLSECFKILEIFVSDPTVEMVFGDRTQKKKKLEDTNYRQELEGAEKFFAGILQEKTSWRFKDPFCPAFALRKVTFQKVSSDLTPHGWHLTPELQRVSQTKNLVTQEVPLYAGSRRRSKRPFWTEALGLLHFVLFRI